MTQAIFDLLSVDPVTLTGHHSLTRGRLMSPYVWKVADGQLGMLVRAIDEDSGTTGSIWHAQGDGLVFEASAEPVIAPGPGDLDIGGCEDPTLVRVEDGCLVYYTGIGPNKTAQLLWAAGPDIRSLEKRGVAHASTAADRNTKEAAVERRDDQWLLLFEYSRDGHSRIGRAESKGPAGPWHERGDPMHARPGQWDCWHLSTGPLLIDEPGGPVMFYNGANADARWSIGWVRFDQACGRVIARCDEPVISPPTVPEPAKRQMVFAASAIHSSKGHIWLFYTLNDRSLMRATLRCRTLEEKLSV